MPYWDRVDDTFDEIDLEVLQCAYALVWAFGQALDAWESSASPRWAAFARAGLVYGKGIANGRGLPGVATQAPQLVTKNAAVQEPIPSCTAAGLWIKDERNRWLAASSRSQYNRSHEFGSALAGIATLPGRTLFACFEREHRAK